MRYPVSVPESGKQSLSQRADHHLSSIGFHSQMIEQVQSTVLKTFKTGDGVYPITVQIICYLSPKTKESYPPEGHYDYTIVKREIQPISGQSKVFLICRRLFYKFISSKIHMAATIPSAWKKFLLLTRNITIAWWFDPIPPHLKKQLSPPPRLPIGRGTVRQAGLS